MPKPIDRTMPASVICERFGGLTKFAQAFDPPKSLSTVQRWLEGGLIPSRHQGDALEAAKRARVKLKATDFIPAKQEAAA